MSAVPMPKPTRLEAAVQRMKRAKFDLADATAAAADPLQRLEFARLEHAAALGALMDELEFPGGLSLKTKSFRVGVDAVCPRCLSAPCDSECEE